MPSKLSPSELRKKSEAGLAKQEASRAKDKQAAEEKARLQVIEDAKKDAQKAAACIGFAENYIEEAASKGFFAVRVYEIPMSEMVGGNYHKELMLRGAAEIIRDSYKKDGFSVIIDTEIQPIDVSAGAASYKYFLKIGW